MKRASWSAATKEGSHKKAQKTQKDSAAFYLYVSFCDFCAFLWLSCRTPNCSF
jgi:hypothetical protein